MLPPVPESDLRGYLTLGRCALVSMNAAIPAIISAAPPNICRTRRSLSKPLSRFGRLYLRT